MKRDVESTFEKIKRPVRHAARPNSSVFPTCSGKQSFTKKRARHTAHALNSRHGVERPLYIYKCSHSNHYHLTSMPRARYRKHETLR